MWKLLVFVALFAVFHEALTSNAPRPAEDDKDNACWNATCPPCHVCHRFYKDCPEEQKDYCKPYCVPSPGCAPADACATKKCEPAFNCVSLLGQATCVRDYTHQRRCFLPPMEEGDDCKGPFPRWSYDRTTNACYFFHYKGCGGNNNRFLSEGRCLNACAIQF